MKKFILFAILILTFIHTEYLFLAKPAAISANAEEEPAPVYACALSHDVYLYGEENENSGLFRIPYTYYVKVLASGIEYSYVQYSTNAAPFQAVYGYCKTSELFFVDFVPVRPFLYYTLDVTYRLDNYSDFFKQDEIFSTVTLTYAYYGDYTVGSSTYCYVCLDGKMGYLPKTMNVTYDLNTDYQTSLPEPPVEEKPSSTATLPTAQIVLISVMVLLACGVVYFLLHPRKLPAVTPNEEFEP